MPSLPRARRASLVVALLASAAALAVAAPAARAAAAPARVIPNIGPLYDGLGAAWWRYAVRAPAATSPLLDTTGEHCADGQRGPIFFLAGSSGSGSATRDCVVHGPRALFFPIVNVIDLHVPGDGLDTPEKVLEELVSLWQPPTSLRASVDGTAIDVGTPNFGANPFYACSSPARGCFPRAFSIDLPEANIFGLPGGRYAPVVQQGYYLLLAPLAPGRHTIAFGAEGPLPQDITYHLTVSR